ncbi:pilus assembly protein PilP [Vibrio hepatarius]|uniref:pilus assembly protein PilP n=1 Tax=Vibrio hepatarius TaxID=171383 RepID=UPI001C08F705|nr:pilus assembly protein PilP [Vibrio hepatarius]MBU2896960.1 pilus assembly protein PilP [Vibrio hepatarius]
MRVELIIILSGLLLGYEVNSLSLEAKGDMTSHLNLVIKNDVMGQSIQNYNYLNDIKLPLKRDPFSVPLLLSEPSPCDSMTAKPSVHAAIVFPLEKLRLAGVIYRQSEYIAMIELPDGILRAGVVGQEIGLNQAIITNISSDEVQIGQWEAQHEVCRLVNNISLTISE